jgi:hypothetical protein
MDTLRESEVALRMQVQQLKEEEGVLTKKGRVKNKRIKDLMEEVEQKDKELATQATEAKTTATRTGKVCSTRTRLHFLSTALRYFPCSTDRILSILQKGTLDKELLAEKKKLEKMLKDKEDLAVENRTLTASNKELTDLIDEILSGNASSKKIKQRLSAASQKELVSSSDAEIVEPVHGESEEVAEVVMEEAEEEEPYGIVLWCFMFMSA